MFTYNPPCKDGLKLTFPRINLINSYNINKINMLTGPLFILVSYDAHHCHYQTNFIIDIKANNK